MELMLSVNLILTKAYNQFKFLYTVFVSDISKK